MTHDWKELTEEERRATELRGLLRRCGRCGTVAGVWMEASDGDCDVVMVRDVHNS